MTQAHASFVVLNSPEADEVAALLALLGAGGGRAPGELLAAAGAIDVTMDSALKPMARMDVIKGEMLGVEINEIERLNRETTHSSLMPDRDLEVPT